MAETPLRRVANSVAERLTSVWKLLSETTTFLSRTPIFSHYEPMLRDWRASLQRNPNNPDVVREIRQKIIDLRKSLRAQNYDLSLAWRDVQVLGFLNDAALGDGFVRLVIWASDTDIYYVYGQDNHIELASQLEAQARRFNLAGSYQRHYLWYLWRNNVLYLAGSDSESKSDYDELRAYVEAHKELVLQRLRRLP